MFAISITYASGGTQQIICEDLENAQRGWKAISDALEDRRAIVILENPGAATTFALSQIASVAYGEVTESGGIAPGQEPSERSILQ